jgi:hypothetical protein
LKSTEVIFMLKVSLKEGVNSHLAYLWLDREQSIQIQSAER